MQVECASSQDELMSKRKIGFWIAGIGLFTLLLFQCFLEHIYRRLKIMNRKLDEAVLTADDFTVSVDLPE